MVLDRIVSDSDLGGPSRSWVERRTPEANERAA